MPNPQLYEDKFGEWRWLNGRAVVVDYAMQVQHMQPHEIDKRVRTIEDVERL